jgi:hypothetical protein
MMIEGAALVVGPRSNRHTRSLMKDHIAEQERQLEAVPQEVRKKYLEAQEKERLAIISDLFAKAMGTDRAHLQASNYTAEMCSLSR